MLIEEGVKNFTLDSRETHPKTMARKYCINSLEFESDCHEGQICRDGQLCYLPTVAIDPLATERGQLYTL
jgi:hypothetical protein